MQPHACARGSQSKHSPGASMVDIVLAASRQAVTISVHDYSIGIPKAQQQHIFERFYRAKGSQEKTVAGLGMGLFITVESEEGQGSTFLVSLPRP